MIDSNNIILITDNDENAKLVLGKLILLRSNDKITVCKLQDAKNAVKNSLYSVVVIIQPSESNDTEILKLIKTLKQEKQDMEILLVLQEINQELILKAYDSGIYDYLTINSENYDFMIKTVNCFKIRMLKEQNERNENFLVQSGAIDTKTGLYKEKYIKDCFVDLSANIRIKNGTFTILALDDANKTKISTNRLALTLKSSIRDDDIAARAKNGKFYLILPNIDLLGTKEVLQKIQTKMGENFKIRAGISKIGIQSFETLEKNANDGLISAMQNDVIAVSLEHNIDVQNSWLEDDESGSKQKNFKLFKNAFDNKMNNVITPLFYRYKKEYENKLTNTEVSQYANDIESVFSLKNENVRSELTIRYNGFAKFQIEITHSGLDSAENTKLEIPIGKLTDKYLITLLKQLKNEYKQSAYEKR